MELSDAFRIVNLVVAAVMVTGGVAYFINLSWKDCILGVYVVVFGAATALLEFQIPPQISRYANFMFSFIGRGIFYVFVGSLILGEGVFWIITGTIVGIIGLIYAILEFIPSIEPPANMREADAGWGAEAA